MFVCVCVCARARVTDINIDTNSNTTSSSRAATIVLREDNCHFLRVDKDDFNRILRVRLLEAAAKLNDFHLVQTHFSWPQHLRNVALSAAAVCACFKAVFSV